MRRELADDAEWLAALVVRLVPDEPEPLALLALIGFHLARWDSRVAADGRVLLLPEQDRATWDRARIARSTALLARAAAKRRPGAYQIEAAIAAVHCEAASWPDTDWAQIRQLYRMLAALDPSPVVLLNEAIVTGELDGPELCTAGDRRPVTDVRAYHLFHATRADMLRRLGRTAEARSADERALALTLTRRSGSCLWPGFQSRRRHGRAAPWPLEGRRGGAWPALLAHDCLAPCSRDGHIWFLASLT